RYWVERSASGFASAHVDRGKRQDVGDWFYLPSWKRSALPDVEDSKRGPWLVFADSSGLADRIVRRLAQARQPVVSVVAGDAFAQRAAGVYSLNPAEPRDY